jgi:hypothetical protein
LLRRGDVAFALLPGAYDVAKRFFLRSRDVHGGQGTGAQREGEVASVEPIGLDAHAGSTRDQRGRGDEALLPDRLQVALQPKTARPRFIDELQRATPGEFLDEAIDCILLRADRTDIHRWLGRTATDARCGDGVFVNIEADEDGGIVSHADLRLREPDLSVHNRRSCGSGLRPIRDHGLSEVSASFSESHTV